LRIPHHLSFRFAVLSTLCLTLASVCAAQCTFPAKATGRVLTYIVAATVTPESTVLHITLKFQGNAEGAEEIEFPAHWAGETIRGVINLRAISSDTVLTDAPGENHKMLHYPPNQPVVLAYDVVKDWTGPFKAPLQFHGVIMPEYIEINGDNALVHPKMEGQDPVTANFDWQKIPAAWALATSFGTSSGPDDRCQSYSGKWTEVEDALFTAGDFRIHHFQIGKRPAVLAIRGQWTFTDEQVIADIQKVVGIVRDFWHDDNFPYFLVTLKAYDQDHGSGDGSGFTNAFWLYMSRLDPFTTQLTQLSHESFHAWNPRRMGPRSDADDDKVISWFHEGFTTYYADVLVYRASLMPLTAVIENINRDLRDYPKSESPYVRGRVIATWLDWQIRKNSNNKSSLDNMMFDMVHEADKPLTNDRILQTAGRYIAPAARVELQQAVQQHALPQMSGATFGPCVQLTIDDLPRFDLGLDYVATNTAHKITGVVPDGPAYKAGLRDGQLLNGRVSVYNGHTDKPAIFTIQTDDGTKAIEYYPRGKTIATPQFHLDEKTYAANEASCRMQ